MRMRKKFAMGVGKYYFNVYSGNTTITIHREDKDDALRWYSSYKRVGKNCEWLGLWNGKEFEESDAASKK